MREAENKEDFAQGKINGLREFYYGQFQFASWLTDEICSLCPLDPFDNTKEEYAARREKFITYTQLLVKVSDAIHYLNEDYEAELKGNNDQ